MAAPAALPEFKGNVVAVQTAPFWDEKLGAIADKHDQVRQMGYLLKSKNKNEANADGSMTEQQQREYLKQFEAKLISPGGSRDVETRRLECRLPLPRLREDFRAHGKGLRGGRACTYEDQQRRVLRFAEHRLQADIIECIGPEPHRGVKQKIPTGTCLFRKSC